MKAALLVLALLASSLLLLPSSPPASAQTLLAQITGPKALAPSQLAQYNVTIVGGPTGVAVNYTIQYYITGANVTGGAPPASSPGQTQTNKTLARVNVTAPPNEQTITITFLVTARAVSGAVENTTADYPVVVIKPILLTVSFHNASPTAATNVSVRFYVDNAYVGSTKVTRFAPSADTTVSFNYLPASLSAGQHAIRAEADLNGDGVIEQAQGEVAVSDLFYHSVESPALGWTWILALAVFAIVFFAVLLVRRRSQA